VGRCPAWISLESAGVTAHGCLRSPSWIHELVLPVYQPHAFSPYYIYEPSSRLTYLRTSYKGTYGHIDLARYETSEEVKEVYVKRPIHQGNSLIHEACVKIVVRQFLASIGIEEGAPRIVRIFRLRDGSVCFAMEQIVGSVTLSEFLSNHAKGAVASTEFSQIIMDCLFQLCGMMWHLENRLGLNHRDLTPGNFLVVEHPPRQKTISVGTEIFEITSTHSLTLIDFGFSCIGSVETQVSELALSEMYHETDPCPKVGRDLFLFLGLVYVTYYGRMPPTMRELFEGWIHNEGLCKFLRKDAENAQHWLYFMIRDTAVKRFYCTAEQIVADLLAAQTAT
jgi:serine/threonine protein kinase